MKKNDLIKWARKEIDLAIVDETNEKIKKHYETAFSAFSNFIEKISDLENIDATKTIFLQLLNKNILTPITDDKDEWVFVAGYDPSSGNKNHSANYSFYQSKRRNSLYKKVIYAGEMQSIFYSDSERAVCVDIQTRETFTGGFETGILDEMYPISIPYYPIDKIKIYVEKTKVYENSVDCDTVGILYFCFPNGKISEIKRFFKRDTKTNMMTEIDLQEYEMRFKKAKQNENKKFNKIFDDVRKPLKEDNKMNGDDQKLVNFEVFCPKCKHYAKSGSEEPCNQCLTKPTNTWSHKPINFIKK